MFFTTKLDKSAFVSLTATSLLAFVSPANAAANVAPTISGTPQTSTLSSVYYAFTPRAYDANGNTLKFAIAGKPARDPYTSGHQHRVGDLAAALGREVGLDRHRVEGLLIGGYLHDVGKIFVPAEILTRPGRLNEMEFAIVRAHPRMGHDILKGLDFPWPVAQMALQHHERCDGTGYPDGLKGDEFILEARIIAVADVVEAMANHRPYRPALGLEAALAEIEAGSGTRYDPSIAAACARLFSERDYHLPG